MPNKAALIPPANILIVDDEPRNLLALEQILLGQRHHLIQAGSGEEALRCALKDDFAVILLDVRMPGLDGFETAKLIRQRKRSAQTPIIFLTGVYEDVNSMFRGYEVGAVDYILKPVVPEVLQSKIAVFVELFNKTAELDRQKEALREAAEFSEQRFYDLVQGLDAIVWEADSETGKFSFVSKRAESVLGYSTDQWLKHTNFRDTFVHPDDLEKSKECYKKVSEDGSELACEYRARTVNGEEVWLRDHVHMYLDKKGGNKLRGVMVDITPHKQSEARLAHLAHHDPLTHLPNRTLLRERLEQALGHCHRHSDLQIAVLFIDLDRFKNINDSLGHKYGDMLLLKVAERLQECVRENDTIARIGGDEFIVLLSAVNDAKAVDITAQKILKALASSFDLDGQESYVSCSIGISMYPGDGDHCEALLKNADTAMYMAKEQGRNNCQFYTSRMNAKTHEWVAITNSLHRALERDEFVLHYQPIIDMRKQQIIAVEALLRWRRDDKLLLPADFISLLEDSSLMVQVGEWVMSRAYAQNKAWQDAGLTPIRMSVNLSVRQLQNDNFADKLGEILKEVDLDPKWAELEVTESMIMHNVERVIEMLNKIHELGACLAIDDFGAGYSSLSYLKRFPISRLKIDQSFIRGIPQDKDNAAITLAIIGMAHNLNLRVVAEGVETLQQLEFLKANHCDEIQGFIFDQAMPPEDIAVLLDKQPRLSVIAK